MNQHSAVFTEEEYNEKMDAAVKALAPYRKEGTFSGFDGEILYYEYFLSEKSRGSVVIVHGLSEFTQKYQEFTWYLHNQGYDVFLYDQRCHGRSCRLTERQDMIHVNRFADYAKDLHRFICDVVRRVTDGPLYLYAHSMGGAVAAQYLAEHPDVFCKAVLSAPMVEPLTGGVPPIVARWGLSAYLLFGNGKKKFWLASEFDPDYPFEKSKDQSRARFTRNMEIRLSNPCYCTTPLTIRWVQQSVMLRRKLTRKGFLKKLQTPILMLSAEADGVVSDQAQVQFAKNCPVCRQVVLPGANHSMLWGTRETIAVYVQQVLDHFA